MYRIALSRSIRAAPLTNARAVTQTTRAASTTQGHTTAKAADPGHKDKDIQSASAKAGMSNKADSNASPDGQNQPLDAARQGGLGGESKVAPEGKGAFADQVGGQDAASPGGHKGGQEKTGADTLMGKVWDAFGGQNPKRQYHTSTTARDKTIPGADPKGAREPVDQSVHGDQNPHLKHTEGGSSGSAKSGNAAADPHLPSKSGKSAPGKAATGSASDGQQKRSFHTSPFSGIKGAEKYTGVHEPEPAKAGYDSPSEPLPSNPKTSQPTNNPSGAASDTANLNPSSKLQKSSTSADPAHETLSQAAKDGTLGDRNP